MNNYTGDSAKLILVGVGAVIAFATLGPIGVILIGVVLLFAK